MQSENKTAFSSSNDVDKYKNFDAFDQLINENIDF